VYFGWGVTWEMKELSKGQSIRCTDGVMGCDPSPATSNYCFKVQDIDPDEPVCCGGDFEVTQLGQTRSGTVSDQEYANHDAAMAAILEEARDQIPDAFEPFLDLDDIADQIYEDICGLCSTSSAHAAHVEFADMAWVEPERKFTAPPLEQVEQYLVPILALFVLILGCLQCRAFCRKSGAKKYGAVESVDSDSEAVGFQ